MAAKNLDDTVSHENFLGNARHVADGVLNTSAVAPEGLAQYPHNYRNQRDDNRNECRQADTVPEHDADTRNYCQQIAHHNRDDIRASLRDHLDVVGHAGQQWTCGLRFEKSCWQCQELLKHVAP